MSQIVSLSSIYVTKVEEDVLDRVIPVAENRRTGQPYVSLGTARRAFFSGGFTWLPGDRGGIA